MSFNKQSITLRNFSGGISPDDFLSTGKQVLYTENLDINRNSYFVTLNKNSEGRFVTTAQINGFIEAKVGTSKRVFAYCDDGKIYDTSDGSLQYTMGDGVLQSWVFNGFIYFLTNNSSPLNRITISNANSNLWAGNVVENITTAGDAIPTASDVYPVVVLLNEFFYLGSGNGVYKIDKVDVVEAFDIWDGEVVAITRIGGIFKVYSSKGTIAFWDGLSTSIDSFIEVQSQVRGVINKGKVDFPLTGFNRTQSKIKVLNGYTLQDLTQARYSDRLDQDLFKIEYDQSNQGGRLADTLYFTQDGPLGKEIVTYGSENPALSDGFNIVLTKDSNGNNISSINSLYGTEFVGVDTMFIGMESNSEFAVEKINVVDTSSPTYQTSGYLQTTIIDGGTRIQKKKIEGLKLITSDCDVDNTVELQISTNGEAFISALTVNSGSGITESKVYDKVKDWYDIMFKVKFTSDGTTTPKFYEIQLVYSLID